MWEDNGALRGEYLMHSFGACPKDENASHLSQILEVSPHPKYSLSAKACLGILNRAEKGGKVLPEILKTALTQQAARGLIASKVTASTEPTPPAVALEHHPNDSRLKIAEDGMVQTLNARMGTGGECSPRYVLYQKAIGSLCARDASGIGNQYVQEGKCLIMEVQKQ